MQEFTRDEVEAHCTPQDFWVIVDGHVYHLDVDFITTLHPGGLIIMGSAGKDGSATFREHHNIEKVKPFSEEHCIGKLKE
ncbi:hypothetical protein LSCM1_00499 [Leishmania martiniquensis]|uniref:Cytochrome b5 heme-binding domain-containing protein n=1 Tax=Leishmania martiniquensis TaxID=1580590 RepID=A0A836K9W8_9TRYP|nr:hypothetical protein LSCM1_00499 [Leishmania martiniquensis]